MALKDWKKVKSYSDVGLGWKHKNGNKQLYVVNLYNKKLELIHHTDNFNPVVIKSNIKTKQAALKFAKAYMRKH